MFGTSRLAEGQPDEEELVTVDLPEEALFSRTDVGSERTCCASRCRRSSAHRGGRGRRAPRRRPRGVLRAGLDRAGPAGHRPARGAGPRALAAGRGADRAGAGRAEGGGGGDRGPRAAHPHDPDALGGRRERQPAPDHERPARRSSCCRRSSPTRWRARAGARCTCTSCASSRSRGSRRARPCPELGEALGDGRAGVRVGGARAAALGRARAGPGAPLLPPAHGAAHRPTRSTTSASWPASSPARSRPRRRARRRRAPSACGPCRGPRPRPWPRCSPACPPAPRAARHLALEDVLAPLRVPGRDGDRRARARPPVVRRRVAAALRRGHAGGPLRGRRPSSGR